MTDWDKRYQESFYYGPLQPHQLVRRFWSMAPSGSPVIDIAMGTGRDLFLFAEKGWFCCGLDRSWEGIKTALQGASERRLQIFPVFGDAYRLPFKKGSAGAVLVFYFLVREIMSELTSLLRPGGILMYETFLQTKTLLIGPVIRITCCMMGSSSATLWDSISCSMRRARSSSTARSGLLPVT